jgi:hypothetical protein
MLIAKRNSSDRQVLSKRAKTTPHSFLTTPIQTMSLLFSHHPRRNTILCRDVQTSSTAMLCRPKPRLFIIQPTNEFTFSHYPRRIAIQPTISLLFLITYDPLRSLEVIFLLPRSLIFLQQDFFILRGGFLSFLPQHISIISTF